MTDEQAEARFQRELTKRKRRVEDTRGDLADAERRLEQFEKNKDEWITYYKALP